MTSYLRSDGQRDGYGGDLGGDTLKTQHRLYGLCRERTMPQLSQVIHFYSSHVTSDPGKQKLS